MRFVLLFITLFHMNIARAQFWPMPLNTGVAQNQVPNGMNQRYGYPQPWFRQPLPYFQQQPMNPFGGGPFGASMFPQQSQNPFANLFGGGMNQTGHVGINLNFNLDQLFGGNGLGNIFNSGSNQNLNNNGAPYCEICEQNRRRNERIDLDRDNREREEQDYHTEARVPYVRQPDTLPNTRPSSYAPTDRNGERIANNEELPEVYSPRQLPPPPAPVTRQRPVTGVSENAPDPRPNVTVQFRVRMHNEQERDAQRSPIWNLFIRNFMACVPAGCEPTQYHVYGERGNRSCHPQGRAIDVHAIACNGDFRHPHKAINNDPIFNEMVRCMGGVPGNHVHIGRMAVLWHQNHGRGNVTEDHRDHVHFSAPEGCMVGGRRMY